MTSAPQSLPPSVDIPTAASPGEGATTRCACGHGEVFHDFAKNNRTRKACSVSEGRKATPCGCRLFAPELPDFPQENH